MERNWQGTRGCVLYQHLILGLVLSSKLTEDLEKKLQSLGLEVVFEMIEKSEVNANV